MKNSCVLLLLIVNICALFSSCGDGEEVDVDYKYIVGTYSYYSSEDNIVEGTIRDLIATFNGDTIYGGSVTVNTDDGKTAIFVLRDIIPNEADATIPNVVLTKSESATEGAMYSFSGTYNNKYNYVGTMYLKLSVYFIMSLDISSIAD